MLLGRLQSRHAGGVAGKQQNHHTSHWLIASERRLPEAPPEAPAPPEAQHTSSSAAHAAPSAPGKTPEQTSSKPITARTQAAAVRHWVRFPLPWQATRLQAVRIYREVGVGIDHR